jgi:hypothetical protein
MMIELGEIYVRDLNPFNLAPPPLWWQQGLWSFDADLRILPGRKKPVWWLARVKKYSKGLTGEAIVDDQNDTAMFVRHDLVPVTWIASTEGWSEGFLQYIVAELMARDTWAVEGGPLTEDGTRRAMFEGGSKYGRLLDERDDAERAAINHDVRDDVYQATGDAWRSLQARTGERVLNAGVPHPASAHPAAARPPQSPPLPSSPPPSRPPSPQTPETNP